MRMKSRKTDWPVFIISGGSLLLFVIAVFEQGLCRECD